MPTNNKIVTIDVLAHFKELLCENVKNIYAGYYNSANGKFYEDSTYQTEIASKAESIYINISTNTLYRWSGSGYIEIVGSGNQIQYSTMPNADASLLNTIVQYVGSTNLTYTNGFFYKCITNNGTYIWEQTNVQPASSGSVNIIEGYYNTEDDLFYEEDTFATEIIGAVSTIYIDLLTSKTYRWNGTEFVRLDDEYIIATDSTVGFVKPDNVTTFVDTDGTLRTKVWAGTLERYNIEKDKIPNDTTIIIVDGDESESGDGYVNGIKIVSWGDGTDEEIAAMIAGADEGKINLTDYWSVGDMRKVTLSAMDPGVGLDGYIYTQTINLILMNEGYPGEGNEHIHFVWGQRDCLKQVGRMNGTATCVGSWGDSAMRGDLNTIYFNALPAVFRSCLKPFNTITASVSNPNTNQISRDYISLFAEKEIFGNNNKSTDIEANVLSQMEYYKIEANRLKVTNSGDLSSIYWLRSPYIQEDPQPIDRPYITEAFCNVSGSYSNPPRTSCSSHLANSYIYVAPFGCI